METACYCDYGDPPLFYQPSRRVARKEHRCEECGEPILPGERYEDLRALWPGGPPKTMRTCPDCLAIREALSEMPCFCWLHGGLWEAVSEQFLEAFFTPGGRFAYLRILARHRAHQKRRHT